MENGRFFGSIPKCKGAWAEGRTLEDCREELRDVLKEPLLVVIDENSGLRHHATSTGAGDVRILGPPRESTAVIASFILIS
jgi:predicted RNase H-like HicB family nuclease